jgi:hypothetical protein
MFGNTVLCILVDVCHFGVLRKAAVSRGKSVSIYGTVRDIWKDYNYKINCPQNLESDIEENSVVIMYCKSQSNTTYIDSVVTRLHVSTVKWSSTGLYHNYVINYIVFVLAWGPSVIKWQEYIKLWPASWSSGHCFWLLIMRSWVRFPANQGDFSLIGENPHGDHGLGS